MNKIPSHENDAFNKDVLKNDGYLYTTNSKLSSVLANKRMTDAILGVADFAGKKVVDIGCGDGTYTIELFDIAGPSSVVALDPAAEAVRIARSKVKGRPIEFRVQEGNVLPYDKRSFDVAYVRGVLHHADRPQEIIKEALRVARSVVILEPNGYNLGLKILEKVSPYHRMHGEKSFSAKKLKRWVEEAGGRVGVEKYAGFVPCFCPDFIARGMKACEPFIESMPLLRVLLCAVYVFEVSEK